MGRAPVESQLPRPTPASKRFSSWGRYPRVEQQFVVPLHWRCEIPPLDQFDRPVLPFGRGRSYGDTCVNDGGILLDTAGLSRFMAFDERRGILSCEAGVTLEEILALTVPRGWFLPVVPGTQHVTVGGAIANDIHGKNHHGSGSFGCHVQWLDLLRSSGERMRCEPHIHADLFSATIGGLGLTGLVVAAELRLRKIECPFVYTESIRFPALNDFFDLCRESDVAFEYTVAWIDCMARGRRLGRGIFFRGNHESVAPVSGRGGRASSRLSIPFDAPALVLNPLSMRLFNALYYRRQVARVRRRVMDYERFFFPLDGVRHWNRLYGRRGFLQYQCVVPPDAGRDAVREIVERVVLSGHSAFLGVLKGFGERRSPGMLSFPRAGVTLALDLPFGGRPTLEVCKELDGVVAQAGGAVYPAKDARMTPEMFAASFPRLNEFTRYVDPRFSSDFWRRMTGHAS
jgi:FAD/FMN-containing dehydrogenase